MIAVSVFGLVTPSTFRSFRVGDRRELRNNDDLRTVLYSYSTVGRRVESNDKERTVKFRAC
jgi:hypothetical protein